MFSQSEILEEFVEAARTTHDWSAILEANEYRARLAAMDKRNERERDPWRRMKQRLRMKNNPAAHEKRKARHRENYECRMKDGAWREKRNAQAREKYRRDTADGKKKLVRKTEQWKARKSEENRKYRQTPAWAAKREIYNANRRAANAARKKASLVCTGDTTSAERSAVGEGCERMVQQQRAKDAA